MPRIAIGLGSNLGNRAENLQQAFNRLRAHPRIQDLRISSVLETEAQGGPPQGRFLNAVAVGHTSLPAQDLLAELLRIETLGGRKREIPNGPRTIDLDLLLYGMEEIDSPNLRVPHPRMFSRSFVMQPLAELAPDWVLPGSVSTTTIGQIAEEKFHA